MFPKKGKVWTYRERGRTLTLIWGIPIALLLAAGIYFAIAESNWSLIVVAVLAFIFLMIFYFAKRMRTP